MVPKKKKKFRIETHSVSHWCNHSEHREKAVVLSVLFFKVTEKLPHWSLLSLTQNFKYFGVLVLGKYFVLQVNVFQQVMQAHFPSPSWKANSSRKPPILGQPHLTLLLESVTGQNQSWVQEFFLIRYNAN